MAMRSRQASTWRSVSPVFCQELSEVSEGPAQSPSKVHLSLFQGLDPLLLVQGEDKAGSQCPVMIKLQTPGLGRVSGL